MCAHNHPHNKYTKVVSALRSRAWKVDSARGTWRSWTSARRTASHSAALSATAEPGFCPLPVCRLAEAEATQAWKTSTGVEAAARRCRNGGDDDQLVLLALSGSVAESDSVACSRSRAVRRLLRAMAESVVCAGRPLGCALPHCRLGCAETSDGAAACMG